MERGAEAVEIARRSGFVAEGDFRGEVGERAEERARGGKGVLPIGAAGQAEIGELVGAGGGAGRGEENVCRLDVAVDDPRRVGRAEPVEDLQSAVDHGRRRERSPPLHHLLEASARHELHRHEWGPSGRIELIDLDDVGRGERRSGAGLFAEAVKRPRILPRQWSDHLHRGVAPERFVATAVDRPHAAAAELADDPVAADALRAGARGAPEGGPVGSPRSIVADFVKRLGEAAKRLGEAAKRPPGMIGVEKRGQAIEHQTWGDAGEERGQDDEKPDRPHRHIEPGRESAADAEEDGPAIGGCEARRGVSGGAVGPRHHHPRDEIEEHAGEDPREQRDQRDEEPDATHGNVEAFRQTRADAEDAGAP